MDGKSTSLNCATSTHMARKLWESNIPPIVTLFGHICHNLGGLGRVNTVWYLFLVQFQQAGKLSQWNAVNWRVDLHLLYLMSVCCYLKEICARNIREKKFTQSYYCSFNIVAYWKICNVRTINSENRTTENFFIVKHNKNYCVHASLIKTISFS